MRHEILLSGKGGQGLILAGVVLAEAAGVYEAREVVQTQVYGPESRGGSSHVGVILSDEPILYPEVTHPDILLALSQEAYDRFAPRMQPGGQLFVDRALVDSSKKPAEVTIHALPFTEVAEALGAKILANVVALGALCEITHLASPQALCRAIQAHTAAAYHESNLRAFEAGRELACERQFRRADR